LKETSVDIAGIHIQEPVTVLTNLAMAVLCLCFCIGLKKTAAQSKTGKYWRLFFLFFGWNTVAGLIFHGFSSYFPENVNAWVWKFLNNLLNVPTSYFLLRANIEFSTLAQEKKKMLNGIALATAIIFTVLIILINQFYVGLINGSLAMFITFIHYLILYSRKKKPGSGLVAFGFGFSFTSVGVHAAKLSVSEWFNHKDISHVIIFVALLIIYSGVKKSLEEPAHSREKFEKAVA
jgi:hypothetical protein